MSDRFELSITRRIDAPLASVWGAWTGHLAEWWCPRPWTTEVIENDWRTGGRSAMIMRGPAGEEQVIESVVLEFAPMARIVLTDAFTVGWIPQTPFMVSVYDFAEEEGGTRYTASARHWDAEAMARHATMGFDLGWNAATDQLEAVAKRMATVG